MSTRAGKALKNQKDKHHTILRELVQELPNKTCAECLAKGPRWSSWSLGVFVCIRCAGIHRNLGVHISKMKSIDLDSWTTEQLENVLKWGNKRAAEYYECYLPKDFVRPQANQALEAFIRNKYEKKLYIKKDGEPNPNPQSEVNRLKTDQKEEKAEKEKKSANASRQRRVEKKRETPATNNASSENTILNMAAQKPASSLSPAQTHAATAKSHSMNDLLSLDNPAPTNNVKHAASSNDLLNFGGWSDPVASAPAPANNLFQQQHVNGQASDPFQSGSTQTDPFQSNVSAPASAPTKSTKESIMSLYSSGGGQNPQQHQQQQQQQQMYGVPGGMYMPQQMQAQQMQQQRFYGQPAMQNNQMNQINQMTPVNQLNSQMQQMAFKQPQQPQQQQMMQNQMMQNQMMQKQMIQQGQFNTYNQQSMGIYNQQPQQQQQQQQQQRSPQMMTNSMQMNNMQNNFNMMGQPRQQQGFMGNTSSSWGVNPQQNPQQMSMMGMGQQQQQQQPIMSTGNMGNFNATNGTISGNSSGNTMNNLLWN